MVGIVPGQPLAVLHAAVDVAEAFGARLICVYVDITSYLAEDPEEDAPADDAEAISAGLRKHLAANLKNAGIRWSFLTLTGNPAHAIGRLAESAGASTIVVGSRARRLGVRLEHLLVGSVAVELTQRQHRPVLIIPLPRSPGNRPPT
uniref:universal stress protein n=1 Tax=Pseudarthrobacter oxydans TaxID=1671 RepID=UPI003F495529